MMNAGPACVICEEKAKKRTCQVTLNPTILNVKYNIS